MTVGATTTRLAATPGRGLAAVLLARRGSVYLPTSADVPEAGRGPDHLAGVVLLEADLLDRGYLLSGPLRAALTARSTAALAAAGRSLLAEIDQELGADRPHIPLFRDFPDSTPRDTSAFYVDRVLTLLFQYPEQPCVLCGTESSVHAVSPCAHRVCRRCFDGTDFSACPICHRRVDENEPFILPRPPRRPPVRRTGGPVRLRVLAHGGDNTARSMDAGNELRSLLARSGALSPQDGDDLATLLDAHSRRDLGWLPQAVPGRETKARVLAWLLAGSGKDADGGAPIVYAAVAERIDTATDVLRLLSVCGGGDAGLLDVPRFGPLPRPLRRMLVAVLDRLDPAVAVEDMRRHRSMWVHAAEQLHPFEYVARHPRAALVFAALRGTRLGDDRLSAALRSAAARVTGVDAMGDRVVVLGWGGRVEAALTARDLPGAVALLSERPGELVRRLDHLLRTADGSDDGTRTVLLALAGVVTRVSPSVLLSALGEIRTRAEGRRPATRVFFPKGGTARIHLLEDRRTPVPSAVVEAAARVLTGEVLRRAGTGAPVELAIVDAAIDGLIAPFTQRTASRSLLTLPRGSELPVPDGRTLRLFLHWMENDASGRVDLDLSLAMFDADWKHIGTCDYTSLRFADAAVHSGDLTSAPAPKGATEFVDLDLDRLGAAGVRYALAVVFSFDNIPFEDLEEGFAGLMARDLSGDTGQLFDPRTVEQRFDLTGRSRATVPLVIDTAGRTMRWLDVVKGVTGTNHAVWQHADDLTLLGRALTDLFASGSRVGMGELAVWQAAARAGTVVIRHADGSSSSTYRRRPDEGVAAFAARIGSPDADGSGAVDTAGAGLAYLLRGDCELPEGCETFALYPAALDAGMVRLLTADDVVAALNVA